MISKVLNKIAILLSVTLLSAACEEKPIEPDVPVADPEITLGKTENTYGFEQGSDAVSFTVANPVSGVQADVKSNASWVQVTDVSKSSFKFSYDKNTEYTDRTAALTISYGKAKPVTFTLHQQAAPVPDPVLTLEVTENSYGFEKGSGTVAFSIENPVEGVKAEVESNSSWVKITEIGTSSFKFEYEQNEEYTDRTAVLTLSYGKARPVTFTLHQQAAPVPDPVINPETTEIKLDNKAGKGSFAVTVENPTTALLEANSDAGWLTVDVTSSNGWLVKYSYDANASESVRTATITLTYSGAETRTVKVSQEKADSPVIELDNTTMNFNYLGGSTSIGFTVKNPIAGKKISVSTDSPDWISLDYIYEHSIQFGVYKNNELKKRQAKIFFDYEGAARQTLIINQEAGVPNPEIILTAASMTVDSKAGDYSFTFEIKNPIDGSEATVVSNSPDWIDITGNSNSKGAFSVTENTGADERQGKIFVYYNSAKTQTFTVTQKGRAAKPEIVLTAETVEVEAKGGEFTFTYKVNNPVAGQTVTVASKASDWITIAGYNDTKATFRVAENTTAEARQGKIYVLYDNAETKAYTVTQKGTVLKAEIIVSSTEINLDEYAGNGSFSVKIANPTDARLTATSSQSWLRTEVVKSTDWTVRYSYDANTSDTARSAVVTLNYGDAAEKTVKFSQQANTPTQPETPEIIFTKSSIQVSGKSGGYPFEIRINNPVFGVNPTAKADCDWIHIDSASSSTILFTVDKNSTGSSRNGHITVSYKGAADKTFTVTQDALKPVLNADPFKVVISPRKSTIVLQCSVENPIPDKHITASYDNVDWVEVNVRDECFVKLIFKENTTYSERTFNFTWKYPGADDVTVPVLQRADTTPKFTLESESIVIDKLGTAVSVPYIAENGTLQSITYEKPNWLSIGYNSSEKYILFKAEENKTGAARNASIAFCARFSDGTEITRNIYVTQSASDYKLTINPSSATVNCQAGTVTVSVSLEGPAGGAVKFESSNGWVSLSKCSDTSLTMAYTSNNNKSDRSDVITITYPNHTPVQFKLYQYGNPALPDNAVDLGLSSGLLWATANIGAGTPSDAGNFYAWGEKTAKHSFSWTNYAFGTDTSLSKYTGNSYQLEPEDDIATKALGKGWRIPTNTEWLELENVCDITETAVDGVSGIQIKSRKTGQSIFLPNTGYKDGNSEKQTSGCYLWTSTRPHKNPADDENGWFFNGDGCIAMPRYIGMPIRAVYDPSK